MKKIALPLICLAVLGAVNLRADTAPTTRPAPLAAVMVSPAAAALQQKVMDIAPRCVALTVGLVSITNENGMMGIASGSGVMVSSDGLILTAGHVIAKPGNAITVRFVDGKVVKGIALGIDHLADTGLVRITDPAPGAGWDFALMAPDDNAKLGEWVLATGNPGSIVVGRNPPLRLGRVTGHTAQILRTNCALEPGDSGGPVFDLEGRVVGINSKIMTNGTSDAPLREYSSLHVPMSLFTEQWKELLAGTNVNPEVNLNAGNGRGPGGPGGFGGRRGGQRQLREALDKLAAQKDPEAMKLLADLQEKGGRLGDMIPPDQAAKLIARAAALTPTTTPAHADAPTPATKPSLGLLPTTHPAQALSPTTHPDQAMVVPATRPSQALVVPATKPAATQPAMAQGNGMSPADRANMAARLRQTLQAQFPTAKVTDAIINRILDKATYDGRGRLRINPDDDDLKAMGISPTAIAAREAGIPMNRASAALAKTSLQTLAFFAPALDAAGDCVVEIRSAGSPVLLGTVVSSDGYIVTKASDLPANPTVVLPDGRSVTPRVIGKDTDTDIALLKVRATGLTPVSFAAEAPLGEWLASPTADPNEPAVGVVSDVARPIPDKFSHFAGEQKLILGVGFRDKTPVISMITKDMPADKAGIKIGDEVLQLNGQPVPDSAAFTALMKKTKTGDHLTIKVRRDGKELELTPVLGETKSTTATNDSIGEADNVAGGKLSKRRTSFPMAIESDVTIWADQCGGPLINLQGQTVGVNIARYDRVCTFAIPATVVEKTVEKLRAAAK